MSNLSVHGVSQLKGTLVGCVNAYLGEIKSSLERILFKTPLNIRILSISGGKLEKLMNTNFGSNRSIIKRKKCAVLVSPNYWSLQVTIQDNRMGVEGSSKGNQGSKRVKNGRNH